MIDYLKRQWNKNGTPYTLFIAVLFFFVGFVGVIWFSYQKRVSPLEEAIQKVTPEQEPTITAEAAFEALKRSHPNAEKICIESGNKNSFLFKYTGTKPEDFNGWYVAYDIPFYVLKGNNTWFTVNLPNDRYIQIFPDVTGLTCKDK